LRLLADQVPVALWIADQDLRVTLDWGHVLRGNGAKPQEFAGRTVCEFLGCTDPHTTPIAQHYDALRGIPSHFEFVRNERVLDVRLQPLWSPAGEIRGCIGAAMDVTERKKAEEQMRYQATHDALTGLANYREFLGALEREVRRAERAHNSFALLLLDLDELKHINDQFGHLTGNRALKRLAAVMKQQCRSVDLGARYGGDEFAVLLIDADPAMAQHVTERIENALHDDSEEPRLSVSIGVGVFPDDGRTASELLDAADQHLYRRKRLVRATSH
jgi:diguanylate cyclase (GGDEF)-like protein/PAS domain S-box-containing protein